MKYGWIWISAVAVLALLPMEAAAQQTDTAALRRAAEQRLGRSISTTEVMRRLRESGMSRAQVQEQLRLRGFDPSLADAYFDALEGRGRVPEGSASSELLIAMGRIGLAARQSPLDSIDSALADSALAARLMADTLDTGELDVFGLEIFRRTSTEFVPVINGPVGPDYRLGPGDEVTLVLTGDVELAHTLDVTRDGFIVIPDVGRVSVNGLTLARLEDQLISRLGAVYSGVQRGSGATTFVQVSLGRLRAIQVYVTGDVARPSAYQVTAVSTVFDALYQAGGPTRTGTFRNIEIHRGGRTVSRVDLYDYIMGGNRDDVRLEQGDFIFVPPAEAQVGIQGAVRRPARYELRDSEGLVDLIRFAGGLRGEALLTRIQIDRVLPASQRQPGIDRTFEDVNIATALQPGASPIRLNDGDIVEVFAVSEVRRNRVVVTGEVRRPGIYQWRPGMTLGTLLAQAEGASPSALTPRAHIYRWIEEEGRRSMLRTPVPSGGEPGPQLTDRDSVVIYSVSDLAPPRVVMIHGYVKEPGEYELATGMTVKDLVLAAGGFTFGADMTTAHVARQTDLTTRTDAMAVLQQIPLARGAQEIVGQESAVYWLPEASEFELQHSDQVFIRKAPGFAEMKYVQIYGEVLTPGTYVLGNRQERLTDLLRRAGNLTPQAYADGFQLVRAGTLVATELARAIADPSSRYNLALEPGDSLFVPRYDPTVKIMGMVPFESRVLYEPGRPYQYYIERAGGLMENADAGRITLSYPDGERATVRRSLLIDRSPPVRPGTVIHVPGKPESNSTGTNWDAMLTRMLAVLSTAATVYLATK